MNCRICSIHPSPLARLATLIVLLNLAPLALGQVASVVVLSATPGAAVQGQPVTFTAGVPWTVPAAAATGTITVTDQCSGVTSPTLLGTITLDPFGQGTLQVSAFPCLGANTILANYSDDSNYSSGTSLALIETVLPPLTPTSTILSSSLDPSPTQSVAFDAALSFTGDCPFIINEPSANQLSAVIGSAAANGGTAPQEFTLATTPGEHRYAIDFAGSGVILPDAASFTYDPSSGFSGFQVQWFGATFDFTAVANNASGCGAAGPALGFALLKQALTQCSSGMFAPYVWNAAEVGEGYPYTFSFSYPNPQSGLSDITLTASVPCPSNSCGHTLAKGTWTIRDASTPPAPTVSCPTANSGVVGSSFASPALSVAGGTPPYTFKAVGNLPDGLSMDSYGAITGTPTNAGVFSVEVSDTNGVVARNSTLPQGTVTFNDTKTGNVLGSANIVTSGGTGITKTGASLQMAPLPAGSYAVQAAYSGDTVYAASTSSILNEVAQESAPNGTTTILTADMTQIMAGQSVALTALVSSAGGTPTGTVSFIDGTNLLGALSVDATGRATLTVSLAAGRHPITAAYGGDGISASSASATVNVNMQPAPPNATATTLNFYPVMDGVNFVLAATVTPASPGEPTGTVTFQDVSTMTPTLLGAATVQNGAAAITVPLAAGTYQLSASYSGDANFAASVGTVADVVSPLGLPSVTTTAISSSANPSAYGQTVSFTATVSGSIGTPTGTVTFNTGSMVAPVSLDSSGKAVFTTAAPPVGSVSVSATYSGDTHNAGSTSLLGQTQNPASTATALAVSTSVVFTATVSVTPPGAGVPTGTVSFVTDSSQTVCASVALQPDGTATCAPSGSLTVGSITAAYSGDTNFLPSSGLIASTQTITFAVPSDQPFGTAPFALSATASSGLTVSFTSSTTGICTVAGATVTLVAAGTCTIQATQAGNAFYTAAPPINQSFNVTQGSQTITFAAPANQTLGSAPFTLSATASSGLTVSFTSSTTRICTVSGMTVTLVAAGTCTIQATQAGNATYAAAPAVNQSFTVTGAIVTLTLPRLTTTPANTTTKTGTVTVNNAAAATGAITLTAEPTIAKVGTAGGAFSILTGGTCTSGVVVSPGGSCTINVQYVPGTSTATATANVTITVSGLAAPSLTSSNFTAN
jgi:large repetitive protein